MPGRFRINAGGHYPTALPDFKLRLLLFSDQIILYHVQLLGVTLLDYVFVDNAIRYLDSGQ